MREFVSCAQARILLTNFITFLNATFFANERKKYLDAKFRVRPNVFKMEQLFTTSDKTRLIRLAIFVKLIMKAFN